MRIIIEKIPQNKNNKKKRKQKQNVFLFVWHVLFEAKQLLYIFYLYKLQKRRIVKERAKQRKKNNNKK